MYQSLVTLLTLLVSNIQLLEHTKKNVLNKVKNTSQLHLVVELDGSQHFEDAGRVCDAARTEFLQKYGLRVLRFANNDVMKNFEGVCTAIDKAVQEGMELIP